MSEMRLMIEIEWGECPDGFLVMDTEPAATIDPMLLCRYRDRAIELACLQIRRYLEENLPIDMGSSHQPKE